MFYLTGQDVTPLLDCFQFKLTCLTLYAALCRDKIWKQHEDMKPHDETDIKTWNHAKT